ncbi:unnamed protein product [Periconia digitata]|uniref:Uncharacterized protein n=1 Tax=Periconia digitata TaxID=1303443 RepID=A0A9W4U3E1_9PLEO|nr:unnamed protein product [Periconia digitata]
MTVYDRYNYDRGGPRHDTYYSSHGQPSHVAADGQTAMNYSDSSNHYPSTYHHSYESRYSSAATSNKQSSRHPTKSYKQSRWPPSPSVEDEVTSLAKEFPTLVGSQAEDNSEEAKSRGTVDQQPIIESLYTPNDDERRFVLVSDPQAHSDGIENGPALSDNRAERHGRRRSHAERGNMAPLNTNISDDHDSPLIPERTSTPYAYTKPQKESIAPSDSQYFLSPESLTSSTSSIPRSIPNQAPDREFSNTWGQRTPTQASSSRDINDTFEDSDGDSDSLNIPPEPRRSGRYSFVKSEIQKEDLRANVLDSQARAERRRPRDSAPPFSASRESSGNESNASSTSSKHYTPQTESPRSSTSSIRGDSTRQKPPRVDTRSSRRPEYHAPPSPVSPSQPRRTSPPRSPRLSSRRPKSPSISRPSSSNGSRPSSPSSFSNGGGRADLRVPVTEADWHGRYSSNDRLRSASRRDTYDYIQPPTPHINVKSPSPSRTPVQENVLPYPVDSKPTQAFMPPEEEYQYDHSSVPLPPSPRQPYPEYTSPSSPRMAAFRPAPRTHHSATLNELPRSPRARSSSFRSQSNYEDRRSATDFGIDRPLPPCPRKEASTQHNDWYKLENCPGLDICPSCYEGVFATTSFADYFSQPRRYEHPTERFCDFSSPWMRIAWVIILKQRLPSLRLIQDLSAIADSERSCPGDREVSTDHIEWYGIPDYRDGRPISNFAICPCDLRMLKALFPSVQNYFARINPSHAYAAPKYTCSFRVNSRRSRKYLDLLMEIDAEAKANGQRPDMDRFIKMVRENAFKGECTRNKPLLQKLWHYIPELPEFTICEECYNDKVWPFRSSSSLSNHNSNVTTLPELVTPTIRPVPSEDPQIGSSCCLYSPRMRKVWERAVQEGDFSYLAQKARERKSEERRLVLQRWKLLDTIRVVEQRSTKWERLKAELKDNEREWKYWE